jgi:predicted transcriptional regulator
MSTRVSVRMDESTVARLDGIADSLGRDRDWVINKAVRNFLELHEWQLAHIQKGIADSDAGRTFTFEEVRARVLGKNAPV